MFYMKKSKYTDSQFMEAIKLVEFSETVPEISQELGISFTFFTGGVPNKVESTRP